MTPAADSGSAPSRLRPSLAAVLVFVIALAIRAVYLAEVAHSPIFVVPVIDAKAYDLAARALLEGRHLNVQFFWQPFFYPFYLAGVYAVTGGSIIAAKVVQAVLGAACCVFVFVLGRVVISDRVGLVAGLMAAAYGPLIFFETELLPTGWAALWGVVLVLSLILTRQRGRCYGFFAVGVIAALATITRPTFLPFVVASAAWLLIAVWNDRARRRLPIVEAALLVAGFVLVVAPVSEASRRVGGGFTFIPASGGINLFIGNNEHRTETQAIRPGVKWERLMHQPVFNGAGEAWRDHPRYFYQQTFDYARSRPLHFIGGLLLKSWQFVSSRELPRNFDPYLFHRWSPLLRVLMWRAGPFGFPFGLLAPLALLGLFHYRRQIPAPVILLLVFYSASIVLVFVAARYRAPIIPVMCVPAAGGLVALFEWIRTGQRRRAALGLAWLAAAMVALSLPPAFAVERARIDCEVEMYRYEALSQTTRGEFESAGENLKAALAILPNDSRTLYCLGVVLAAQGRLDGAEQQFRASIAAEPGELEARIRLADLFLNSGRLDEAIAHYRVVKLSAQEHLPTRFNLAGALATLGRLDEAVTEYQQVISFDPDLAEAHVCLGRVLERQGDLDGAILHLRRAILIDPELKNERMELERMLAARAQSAPR